MPRKKGSGNKLHGTEVLCARLDDATDSIVYLPKGRHTITPSVNGRAKTVTVEVDESITAAFQASLEKRLGENVRPITDFDHAGKGAASAIPKGFRWDDEEGLMLDLEWTGAGRQGIEDRDYSYFSPTFLLAPAAGDDSPRRPLGVARRGPVGSLVNDPAFEGITRIAAASADDDDEPEPKNTMSELVNCGLLTANEAAKEDADKLAAARVAALKSEPDEVLAKAATKVRSTIADAARAADVDTDGLGVAAALAEDSTLETIAKTFGSLVIAAAAHQKQLGEQKERAADAFVAASVKEGKILSENDKVKAYWRGAHLADPEGTEEIMEDNPVVNPDITKRVVTVKAGQNKDDADPTRAAAEELVTAGKAKSLGEAYTIIMKDPEKFSDYRETHLNKK